MPPEVVEKARVCLLNAYGMGLNGHDTPYAPVARAAALAMDGEQRNGATLLGDGRKTSIGAATAWTGRNVSAVIRLLRTFARPSRSSPTASSSLSK